jgi:hypothetical protein
MKLTENYQQIRNNLISEALSKTKYEKSEIYSKFKLKYITLSLSALIVQFSLKKKIEPNNLTFTYIFLLIIGCTFIISQNDILFYIGLIIIFFNNCFDFADGHLARKIEQTTVKGHLLDIWAGHLKLIIFQLTLFIFLFINTSNNHYLYLALFFLLLKSSDLKIFAKANIKNNDSENKSSFDKIDKNSFIKKSNFPIIVSNIFKITYYDGRSKYTDFILLVYLVSFLIKDYLLLEIIATIWFFLNLCIFLFKILKVLKMDDDLKNE